MASKIVIDPVTRIEGHLRVETSVTNGVVSGAWSTGTLFRGVETILMNRSIDDAWKWTQRICGVCTYVHASASVRSAENAYGVTIPEIARQVRNLLMGAQFVQDHIIHFYHLHALDWVDIASALTATAADAAAADAAIHPPRARNADYFSGVLTKLNAFASKGQLGPFANGYWGHPAYALSPAQNLVLVANYLEALTIQKEIIRIHLMLGGRNPHPLSIAVGGITHNLITYNDMFKTNLAVIESICATAKNFVDNYYIPDVRALAKAYPSYRQSGGFGNLLSAGEFPDTAGNRLFPAGVIINKAAGVPSSLDVEMITEDVTRSWYTGSVPLKPSNGVTVPSYTGIDTSEKYSWLKAPRYQGMPMEVGPLARVMVAYQSNVTVVKNLVDSFIASVNGMTFSEMYSTMGRIAARALETKVIADLMPEWTSTLHTFVINGNTQTRVTLPANPSATGFSLSEAPRGALGHWLSNTNKAITRYQMVVPSTWNLSPRDGSGVAGPAEQALIGTPVADETKPLEVLRVIHSYDPCLACAVHMIDMSGKECAEIAVK